MFGTAGTARIWLWQGHCDLRSGIDRLSGLIEEHFPDVPPGLAYARVRAIVRA